MRKQTAVAVIVAATSAGALALAMGPLNPPAGPVAETSPSLADLASILQEPRPTEGPWQVATFDMRNGPFSQNTALLLAEGPVLVHSVNVQRCTATLFNGPGSLSGAGTIATGNVVGRAHEDVSGSLSESFVSVSVQTDIDVVCDNGLYVAWAGNNANASFIINVYYKPLD